MKKKIIYFCAGVLLSSLLLIAFQVIATAPNPGHTMSEIEGLSSGMIVMFDTACPAGWTRFTPLDSAFPRGASTYGATGGASTHTHNFTVPTSLNVCPCGGTAAGAAGTWATTAGSSLPPYLDVLWCKKS